MENNTLNSRSASVYCHVSVYVYCKIFIFLRVFWRLDSLLGDWKRGFFMVSISSYEVNLIAMKGVILTCKKQAHVNQAAVFAWTIFMGKLWYWFSLTCCSQLLNTESSTFLTKYWHHTMPGKIVYLIHGDLILKISCGCNHFKLAFFSELRQLWFLICDIFHL